MKSLNLRVDDQRERLLVFEGVTQLFAVPKEETLEDGSVVNLRMVSRVASGFLSFNTRVGVCELRSPDERPKLLPSLLFLKETDIDGGLELVSSEDPDVDAGLLETRDRRRHLLLELVLDGRRAEQNEVLEWFAFKNYSIPSR